MLYGQDSITEETVELLAAYLDQEDYNLETAKKVCGDVAGLCSWTQAMSFFYGCVYTLILHDYEFLGLDYFIWLSQQIHTVCVRACVCVLNMWIASTYSYQAFGKLCNWSCPLSLLRINKEVLPLKANLAVQEAKLNSAMSDLQEAQAQLDEKQKELDVVQAVYNAAMKKKQVRCCKRI